MTSVLALRSRPRCGELPATLRLARPMLARIARDAVATEHDLAAGAPCGGLCKPVDARTPNEAGAVIGSRACPAISRAGDHENSGIAPGNHAAPMVRTTLAPPLTIDVHVVATGRQALESRSESAARRIDTVIVA
jgi:hypothetical protein